MSSCDSWAYIVDGPRSGLENMRIDRELLDWAEKCSDQITVVRFYRWTVPTISLGKHQKVEEAVNQIYCQQAAIPIVHRPTGGRAVFHDHELTYSLVSNHARYFPLESVKDTYRAIAAALRTGLQSLGIDAQLAEGARALPPLASSTGGKKPCFMTPSRHELLLGGFQVSGKRSKKIEKKLSSARLLSAAGRLSQNGCSPGCPGKGAQEDPSLRVPGQWPTGGI